MILELDLLARVCLDERVVQLDFEPRLFISQRVQFLLNSVGNGFSLGVEEVGQAACSCLVERLQLAVVEGDRVALGAELVLQEFQVASEQGLAHLFLLVVLRALCRRELLARRVVDRLLLRIGERNPG